MLACIKGKINVVKKLIDKVDISKDNYDRFIKSCIAEYLEIVKLHLDKVDITMNKCKPFVQAC